MSKVTDAEIQAITVAPRITEADMLAAIKKVVYFTAADGVRGSTPPGLRTTVPDDNLKLKTFCVITLQNGFTVEGSSGVASPENYHQQTGERIALENAQDEIYQYLGYELKTRLHLIQGAGNPTGSICFLGSFPTTYIGTKVVHAVPMTRGGYNNLRGWDVPSNEDPEDEGYLVQYTDGGQAIVEGFDGYISWSPRDVFEGSYTVGVQVRETTFQERLMQEY